MDDEKLRNWVQEKLDEDVSAERIKRSLEETGHDPSVVDEVNDPFESSDASEHDSVESPEQVSGVLRDFDFSVSTVLIPLLLVGVVALLVVPTQVLGLSGLSPGFMPGYLDLDARDVEFPGFGSDAFQPGENGKSCPDVGVRIVSVEVREGVTVRAEVSRGSADVVMKLLREGEVVEKISRNLEGRGVFRFESTGNRVVFSPEGCESIRDSRILS